MIESLTFGAVWIRDCLTSGCHGTVVAGISICFRPLRYWPVRERLDFSSSRQRALEDHFAAGRAVAGADVHDLIGRAHDAGFVLDDDDGVAGVAEFFEDAHEAVGVARMQADAGFVEDEERVDQPRAEAGGEIDALGFAAGKRARGAIQREIAEADFVEVARGGRGLRSRAMRDGVLAFGDCVMRGLARVSIKRQRVADGQGVEVGEGELVGRRREDRLPDFESRFRSADSLTSSTSSR